MNGTMSGKVGGSSILPRESQGRNNSSPSMAIPIVNAQNPIKLTRNAVVISKDSIAPSTGRSLESRLLRLPRLLTVRKASYTTKNPGGTLAKPNDPFFFVFSS